VNFTREPLVETVIASREGHKLVVRSATKHDQEDFSVDSVEVVSFGHCFFFRCLEKPKVFLIPMANYEIIEVREVRPTLKKPQVEKGSKNSENKKAVEVTDNKEEGGEGETHKREKKRMRKHCTKVEKKEGVGEPIRRMLLPPPTSLISEQIERYKHYLVEHGALLPEEMEGKKGGEANDVKTDKNSSLALDKQPSVSEENLVINGDKTLEKPQVSVKDKGS